MSGQLPLMDSLCGMQSCGDKIDIIVLCGIEYNYYVYGCHDNLIVLQLSLSKLLLPLDLTGWARLAAQATMTTLVFLS